jgi:glycosyltransferase involved in cell wall biosynthesis
MSGRKLSVIVPVYNEQSQLNDIVDYLFSCPCPVEREWIFIDDCSTDRSCTILKALQAKYPFKLIEQSTNQGKGAAVAAGIQAATGDMIIIQDADFEYDAGEIPKLLEPLLQNRADVVYGSRFKRSAFQVHRTYHYFINHLLTSLSNLFSGIYLTDMETCFKVFRSDLLRAMELRSKRFGIEVELTAYLAKTKARIYELPINYYPRSRLQGKKINWKDGLAALFHLIRFNLFVSIDEAYKGLPEKYHPSSSRPLASPFLVENTSS